eukprot:scaffold1945_cov204-Pinguiococcus_pyrenoidosus.AAC.1
MGQDPGGQRKVDTSSVSKSLSIGTTGDAALIREAISHFRGYASADRGQLNFISLFIGQAAALE